MTDHPLEPCPTCEGRGVIRHHIREPHASIRYADPCPDCHEGRPTITVVPCCANQATCRDFSRPHCAWRTDGTADGRVERQAVIHTVLPIVEWDEVEGPSRCDAECRGVECDKLTGHDGAHAGANADHKMRWTDEWQYTEWYEGALDLGLWERT